MNQSSHRRNHPGSSCVACGQPVGTGAGDSRADPRLGRCERCGLRWLLDPPTGPDLDRLYTSGFYVPAPPRGGALVGTLHRVNNAIRLRELAELDTGRLLDVGCGKGRFLAAARDAGWDAVGIEFAHASAEAARANGVEVHESDFLEVSMPGDFDAVTMWHVLEHLPDPAAAVARAADLVRPGGRVVISVPNIDSLQARIGGDSWFHLDLPRHLFHFGPGSLTALVERAGLRVVRIGHFYPEMEVVGLIQTMLNRAGLEDGLLYRFAKRDPDAPTGRQMLASLALALAAAPGAVAWSAVAPLLRTGASIQLVAERRTD